MLVVMLLVLAVAMLAVDVINVPGVDHRRVSATRAVDVHVTGVWLVDVVRTVRAILVGSTGLAVQMPVVEEVLVLTVADNGVATQFIVDVRMLGYGIGSRGHKAMIGLPSRESRDCLGLAA
ncbi:MAG TPA: hypothetical protein VF337_12145 [Candidatus Limnocylindrales bacterium]